MGSMFFCRVPPYGNNPDFDPLCPLCGRCPEDEFHAWRCTKTVRHAVRLMEELANWLEDHAYMGRPGARHLDDEIHDPLCLVVWAMATKTQGFISDKLGTADQNSPGTQFLLKAVAVSSRLWKIRFRLRDKEICRRHGMNMSAYVETFRGRARHEEAEVEEESDEEPLWDLDEEMDHNGPPHMMEL